jgi:hypothetical protein
MKPTKTLAEGRKGTGSNENVVASVEFELCAALHDSVETDFVHSIAGRIIAEPEGSGKAVGKRTPGTLELHSFSSARHWTTASVRKGLEMASPATSQNTGNICSTRKLAVRKTKYKMSSKW